VVVGYEIGQRLCDKFDDVPEADGERLPRVFIAGGRLPHAQPESGSGMNVSNAGRLHLGGSWRPVLRKRCAPHLLHTYFGGTPGHPRRN